VTSHSIDHAVIIWEEREGGFKSLATPERNEQGFLDTNAAAGGAGKILVTNNVLVYHHKFTQILIHCVPAFFNSL
jgi:hypothetical protein